MSITLYYGSGSPYAWRVHLALEQKALGYDLKVLSFAERDSRKPEFLALSPRHRVPVLMDGDFVIHESNAIVEYLDEAYPGRGARLFPGNARQRSVIRGFITEVDQYFDPTLRPLLDQAFRLRPEMRDGEAIGVARAAVGEELSLFSDSMRGEFLAGPLSAADFAFYPLVAFLKRVELRLPEVRAQRLLPAAIRQWMIRIEALPFFDKTFPPNWKKA